ncbi:MAG: MFS transporter [Alloprevotella sp.]|nr:MFS transporter [Alloprevotella sp.]MBR1653042.1 MFS transporter [Alloprevotella sp.]MBR1653277.1 MFS transporter [Alloprevotella sp.]
MNLLKACTWVPSLYFVEGLPYFFVMTVSVILYQRLGLPNDEIIEYTSWLYLPWVIKPFWSPIVDIFRTKRWWIVVMQVLVGASLAGVAFTLRAPHFVQWTLAFFWLMAFSSATHDIAADGFYMLGLSDRMQSAFVGIRSTFYRVATIFCQGVVIMIAGNLEVYLANPAKAWMWTFYGAAALMIFFAIYHTLAFTIWVRPDADKPRSEHAGIRSVWLDFSETIYTFFKKKQVLVAIAFMLIYRLPEAILVKVCPLFLLDDVSVGGLGLTTMEVGFVQGTVGAIGLIIGGILGGILISAFGFKKLLWPMVAAITVPDLVYVLLAYYQPESLVIVNVCIFLEQFGYGFGFTAYMLYLIYFSQGAFKTAHYAFCTLFMALSMMVPGVVLGKVLSWLEASQIHVNYLNLFIIAVCLTPLTFLVAHFIKVDPDFGKKDE